MLYSWTSARSIRGPKTRSRRGSGLRARGLAWALLAPLALVACDDGEDADGGVDAAVDPGRDAGPPRPPPVCEPACAPELTCCDEADGTACVSTRDDPRNCGACGMDCLRTGRGAACEASTCTCGDSLIGCRGTRQSTCCDLPGLRPYCGNLDTDVDNCGECGATCDPRVGNRCDGGECRCGGNRIPCEGTPTSTCCVNGVDVACADLTSDRFNCGVCDNLCQGLERCEQGVCSLGDGACPGGCGRNQICCGGTCCSRAACALGTCGGLVDGGAPSADAGPGPDAGVDGG